MRPDVRSPQGGVRPSQLPDEVVAAYPLLQEGRERPSSPLSGRELLVASASALGFLAAAGALAVAAAPADTPSALWVLLFVAAYAGVSRVEFEVGTGSAVPTQLVLVPALFVLPAAWVPLVVAVAYALGGLLDRWSADWRVDRLPVLLSTCWYALGPALVFVAAGAEAPAWDRWPVYVAALAAQFALDLASSTLREWLGFGIAPAEVLRFLRPVFLVDALLAAPALALAFVVDPEPAALLAVLPLAGVFWLFAHDRRSRIDDAVAMHQAYRGANEEARQDPLTDLANRLGWEEAIESAERRRRASDRAASVILIDVDGLKAANDRHGHHFGDAMLQAIGSTIAATLREHDVVARIGGDEFAVLLPGTGAENCMRTVARLEEAIARRRLGGLRLAASMGAASVPPEPSLPEAIRSADARMYDVKRSRKGSREASGR